MFGVIKHNRNYLKKLFEKEKITIQPLYGKIRGNKGNDPFFDYIENKGM